MARTMECRVINSNTTSKIYLKVRTHTIFFKNSHIWDRKNLAECFQPLPKRHNQYTMNNHSQFYNFETSSYTPPTRSSCRTEFLLIRMIGARSSYLLHANRYLVLNTLLEAEKFLPGRAEPRPIPKHSRTVETSKQPAVAILQHSLAHPFKVLHHNPISAVHTPHCLLHKVLVLHHHFNYCCHTRLPKSTLF